MAGARQVPVIGGRNPRARTAVVWLGACLVLLAAHPALAQDGNRSPTPEELWKTYPLDPRPEPGAERAAPSPAATAPPARRAPRPAEGRSDSGGAPAALFVALAVLAAGGVAAFFRLRRQRQREPQAAAARRATAPLLPALPLTAALPSPSAARTTVHANGPRAPRVTAALWRRDRAAGSRQARPRGRQHADGTASGSTAIAPPDPQRAWTAEMEWRHADDGSRFCVIARPAEGDGATAVGESPPLEWPPTSPQSVQALSAAAERLEASLMAVGWKPLSPGSAWYAKRFAWEPVAAAPSEPTSAPERAGGRPGPAAPPTQAAKSPAERRTGPRRFERRRPWPEGTEDLWRCEIKWDGGYVNSRFQAVVYRPGARRGRVIGASTAFKWRLMAAPDPYARDYQVQAQGLASALEAAGWERAGHGLDWYSQRFVWRRDQPPPDHVEPARTEAGQAP